MGGFFFSHSYILFLNYCKWLRISSGARNRFHSWNRARERLGVGILLLDILVLAAVSLMLIGSLVNTSYAGVDEEGVFLFFKFIVTDRRRRGWKFGFFRREYMDGFGCQLASLEPRWHRLCHPALIHHQKRRYFLKIPCLCLIGVLQFFLPALYLLMLHTILQKLLQKQVLVI